MEILEKREQGDNVVMSDTKPKGKTTKKKKKTSRKGKGKEEVEQDEGLGDSATPIFFCRGLTGVTILISPKKLWFFA